MQAGNKTPKVKFLSSAQKEDLKRKCNNPMNWSDGGYWQGSGKEPKCYGAQILKTTRSHTLTFQTDEKALEWNLAREKEIRYAGHAVTYGMTILLSRVGGVWGGAGFATLVAISKDEIQASIPYPRVAKGWTHTLTIDYEYRWSPMKFADNHIKIKQHVAVKNTDGEVTFTGESFVKYSLDDIPESLAKTLASQPSKETFSDY